MQFSAHTSFAISDRSYMSSAKRDIARMADSIGFNADQKGKIDIIISELTSNLIKHNTVHGEILIKPLFDTKPFGIEILSVDNGPGMHDSKRMMEDGVSTYGSKGEGLGAIKRLSDQFDIYSLPEIGTFILSRIFIKNESITSSIKPKPKLKVNVVMVPKSGEIVCGDGWAEVENDDKIIILAADGLGHGKDAHQASVEAINLFTTCMLCVPSEILKLIHNSIKKTRGIVGGIAKIDFKEETLSYCGIGNISGRIISKDGSKSLVSYNGTVGHNIPSNFHDHTYKWDPSNILILHSDGLKSRWDISKYPGIEKHDGSLIAAILYKDNTRRTDDALVIVARK
jgi:anti-sigma regulatory factor (Ser/Thr protein kinase)